MFKPCNPHHHHHYNLYWLHTATEYIVRISIYLPFFSKYRCLFLAASMLCNWHAFNLKRFCWMLLNLAEKKIHIPTVFETHKTFFFFFRVMLIFVVIVLLPDVHHRHSRRRGESKQAHHFAVELFLNREKPFNAMCTWTKRDREWTRPLYNCDIEKCREKLTQAIARKKNKRAHVRRTKGSKRVKRII